MTPIVTLHGTGLPPREPDAQCEACGAQGTVGRAVRFEENDEIREVHRFCRTCWPEQSARYKARWEEESRPVRLGSNATCVPPCHLSCTWITHLAVAVERLVASVPNATDLRRSILSHHTTAEDAGRVAAAAGVGMLVLSHLVPAEDPAITDEMWISAARRHFDGRIVVAKDLMEL